MRFPPIAAIEAALPFAFLSEGSRAAWCKKHGIDVDSIHRWQNKRIGPPKYEPMGRIILAIEASGVCFQGDSFFVPPKPD